MSIQPTVRRTMVIVSTVVLAVLLLASSVMATSAIDVGRGDVAPDDAVAVAEHTVVAGDTLWSIAGRAVGPGEDRRAVVGEIRRLNDLASTVIHPGQVLLIPAG